ncbi:MAG: glycoside hydrolase family protein [Candidatus Accumulibacter sp.]|jgi:lysozyme|nr:glycoside hydrolase family protein [Accumulibacter sp.]
MDARLKIAGLALSLAGFAAYTQYEGWSGVARPPVRGDVATYGFGSTRGPNGEALHGGERIDPPRAVALAVRDVREHEARLKRCLEGVQLSQAEFDAFMSLALNVGSAKVCASSIPAKLKAGQYDAACRTILDFGKFCTAAKVDGKCPPGALVELDGLMKRRRAEYRTCISGGENRA